MNRMENFAILIGALLAAVPVRGQDNVEAIVAQNVCDRFCRETGKEAALRSQSA